MIQIPTIVLGVRAPAFAVFTYLSTTRAEAKLTLLYLWIRSTDVRPDK